MSHRNIGSSGGAGVEPDLKRRRLLDAGGPVEDDETARQKMRDAEVYERYGQGVVGFNPDNVDDIKRTSAQQGDDIYRIKPMSYFAERGDLKMMRWLYVNGADTRDEEIGFYFPMIRAVSRGHIDVCTWLFAHGASDDVQRRTNATSPLFHLNDDIGCVSFARKREMTRWLVLNGALCKENTRGDLDIRVMRKDIRRVWDRQLLLEWANDLQNARTAFLTFLMGTLSPAEHNMYSPLSLRQLLLKKLGSEQATNRLLDSLPTNQHRQLWDELLVASAPSTLNILSGKSGILKLICGFVGIVRGREAHIIRQLVEVLPSFNRIMESL